MGKASRVRKTKSCALCTRVSEVLFRIKISNEAAWQLACKSCQIKHKETEGYQYGGTWKNRKRN
jgi:hypothetical protein